MSLTDRLLRATGAMCAAALLLLASPARAIDESDLLPVDQAFAPSAKALGHDKVELDWAIAKGYYLYRERINATSDVAFQADALQLPEGIHKHDPFFGEVQIYHDHVTATLAGHPAAGLQAVDVVVKYQGCADAGVCYPPQKRTLHIVLPAPATAAAAEAPAVASGTTPTIAALTGRATGKLGATDASPLPPEQAFGFEAIVDAPDRLLLRFTPAKGYYLYRDKTRLTIDSTAGSVQAGPPEWPPAQQRHDEHFGDVAVYTDLVEVPLPLKHTNTLATKIELKASFQGCQIDGICYPPMVRAVALDLPAGGTAAVPARTEPAPSSATSSSGGLFLALLLALGGGLILNLMPCVLPVLSLKAISLVESGESRDRARRHALWYTAGVLASFAALGGIAIGVRQAGLALGWGFQLQQPLVVAALAYLMLAVGLALSGVYQFGAGWAGVGQKLTEKSGPAGDFFTGALAVVVASPCTAPLMGNALAYAFTAPTVAALAVFLALGLGLSLPFLAIGFVPALASRLPRPGAWMETFKQVLAFPMYLTSAWLVSVLATQRGSDGVLDALAGAVALAFGLWLWERGRYARHQHAVRAAALVAFALAIIPLVSIARLPAPAARTAEQGTINYSAAKLAELRATGQIVFVDITADWCITCKANERAVLSRPAFQEAMRKANAVYMVGDYTNVDQPITDFLAAHHAVGIPLYVVYPRGGGEGRVLPNILTQSIVDDALDQATR
ncbi:MAG TPA: protein-disulfide reductase DsbD [Xanthomonadaceae bacterium]|jgi:thiol:disulfide interchange protein DsbD